MLCNSAAPRGRAAEGGMRRGAGGFGGAGSGLWPMGCSPLLVLCLAAAGVVWRGSAELSTELGSPKRCRKERRTQTASTAVGTQSDGSKSGDPFTESFKIPSKMALPSTVLSKVPSKVPSARRHWRRDRAVLQCRRAPTATGDGDRRPHSSCYGQNADSLATDNEESCSFDDTLPLLERRRTIGRQSCETEECSTSLLQAGEECRDLISAEVRQCTVGRENGSWKTRWKAGADDSAGVGSRCSCVQTGDSSSSSSSSSDGRLYGATEIYTDGEKNRESRGKKLSDVGLRVGKEGGEEGEVVRWRHRRRRTSSKIAKT